MGEVFYFSEVYFQLVAAFESGGGFEGSLVIGGSGEVFDTAIGVLVPRGQGGELGGFGGAASFGETYFPRIGQKSYLRFRHFGEGQGRVRRFVFEDDEISFIGF